MVCLVVSHLFISHFGAASRIRDSIVWYGALLHPNAMSYCFAVDRTAKPAPHRQQKKNAPFVCQTEKKHRKRTFHPTLYSLVCAAVGIGGVGVRHKPEKSRNNRLTARAHAQQISALLFPWVYKYLAFLSNKVLMYVYAHMSDLFSVYTYTLDFGRAQNWFKLYTPVPSYICMHMMWV